MRDTACPHIHDLISNGSRMQFIARKCGLFSILLNSVLLLVFSATRAMTFSPFLQNGFSAVRMSACWQRSCVSLRRRCHRLLNPQLGSVLLRLLSTSSEDVLICITILSVIEADVQHVFQSTVLAHNKKNS